MHHSRRQSPVLLLLALLLAAQMFAIAHESAHGFASDNDRCSVCLRADQYRAAAPAAAPSAGLLAPILDADSITPVAYAAARPAVLRARGPPQASIAH